jgi:hypothetical protein
MSSVIFKKITKRPSILIGIGILLTILFGFILKLESERVLLTLGNYKETNGVVTSLKKNYHGWSVYYNYSVDNKNYENNQSLLMIGFDSDYKSGKNIIVKYDVSNPNASIIKSTELQIYIGIILTFFGAFIILMALLKLIKKAKL